MTRKTKRDRERKREIQDAFDNYLSEADDVLRNCIYYPPWRDRLITGELGPEYGPSCDSQAHRAQEEWLMKRESGSLWDQETCDVLHPPRRVSPRNVPREGQDAVLRWLSKNAHQLSESVRHVAYGFFVDMKSRTQLARERGISEHTVRDHLRKIREKAYGKKAKARKR